MSLSLAAQDVIHPRPPAGLTHRVSPMHWPAQVNVSICICLLTYAIWPQNKFCLVRSFVRTSKEVAVLFPALVLSSNENIIRNVANLWTYFSYWSEIIKYIRCFSWSQCRLGKNKTINEINKAHRETSFCSILRSADVITDQVFKGLVGINPCSNTENVCMEFVRTSGYVRGWKMWKYPPEVIKSRTEEFTVA